MILGPTTERFRLWAVVNGAVANWTSRRDLDQTGLRIGFEQERSQPPVASMGGSWAFRSRARGRTEIVLEHHFTATSADLLDAIAEAVDANSEKELAALDRIVAQPHPVEQVMASFTDSMPLETDTAHAYRFIAQADRWPDRLPHVGRVVLTEESPGVQDMEMDTVTRDGGTHTTRSIRLCFPTTRIVYKQLLPPALLIGHSGAWDLVEGPGAACAVATHTVAIDTTRIAELLGPGRTITDARAYLRTVLGANSRTTLAAAAGHPGPGNAVTHRREAQR